MTQVKIPLRLQPLRSQSKYKMLYAIIAEDYPDSLEKRLAVRPAHVSRLQELKKQGKI